MPKRERNSGGLFKIPGSRFFYAQFYRDGRQVRVSTKTDVKAKALASLRKLIGDSERGVTPESDLKKIKYEQLRAGLLGNYRHAGRKSLQTLADGSETINGLPALDEFFKGKSVTQITSASVGEFIRWRKGQDANISNDTVNGSLRLLRRMLTIAYEDEKISRVPKIRLLPNSPARKGFLPPESFDKLIAELPANLKPLVTFLYHSGVRLGEARQIEWAQVQWSDADDDALIVLEDEQTKNGEPRIIPVTDPELLRMLREFKKKEGPVFDATNLRKAWRKACVAAGLGMLAKIDDKLDPIYTGLIVHDLRRSAVRNLMNAGVGESVAMKISGHKTNNVFKRYHIVSADDVIAASRLVSKAHRARKSSDEFGVSLVEVGNLGARRKQLNP
jgi:integrase